MNNKKEKDSDTGGYSSESLEKLNKVMEKLRARLYTLAEASLTSEQQANSFKKAVKDYTAEAWNEITELIKVLEKK